MARPEDTREIVARWVAEHHGAMLRLAGSFADAVHGREDIVSRARAVALERHMDVRDVADPLGWVLAITKSVGLQVVRKRDRRVELRRVGSLEGWGLFKSADEDVFRKWLAQVSDKRREQVLEIARGLPRALRQLVHHMLIDEWDDDEIADHYGITRSAVRRRRKRAVEAISGRLSPPPRTPEVIPSSW